MNRCVAGMIAGLLISPLNTSTLMVSGGVALVAASTTVSAAPLAPEHEVRRLTLAAQKAIAESRWDEAADHLGRLQHIKADKPAEYHFYRGRVMLQANQLNEAQSALETYVAEAGTEGEHYKQSLELITRIESQRGSNSAGKPQEPVAIIEPAERIDVGALQRLYLEDTPADALAAHLNSLLSLNAWQPGPVRKENPDESIEYRVTADAQNGLQIRETQRRPGNGPTVRTRTVPVFGINPIISYDCYASDSSCWLFDPRDKSRWLRLANRPAAAEEVSQVMSELVRQLQKSGS